MAEKQEQCCGTCRFVRSKPLPVTRGKVFWCEWMRSHSVPEWSKWKTQWVTEDGHPSCPTYQAKESQ